MAKRTTFKTVNASNYERRQPKKRENFIFFLPFVNNADEYEIDKEILDVIESTPFNKIQIPLQCSRSIVEENGDPNRYVTVGNVLTYDKINKQFKVIIHKQYKDTIEERLAACEDGELVSVVQYGEFNGKLNLITKICVDVVDYSEHDEECDTEVLSDGDDCSPEE